MFTLYRLDFGSVVKTKVGKKRYGTLFSERFLQRRDLRRFAPEYSPVSNVFILPGRFLQQPKN